MSYRRSWEMLKANQLLFLPRASQGFIYFPIINPAKFRCKTLLSPTGMSLKLHVLLRISGLTQLKLNPFRGLKPEGGGAEPRNRSKHNCQHSNPLSKLSAFERLVSTIIWHRPTVTPSICSAPDARHVRGRLISTCFSISNDLDPDSRWPSSLRKNAYRRSFSEMDQSPLWLLFFPQSIPQLKRASPPNLNFIPQYTLCEPHPRALRLISSALRY